MKIEVTKDNAKDGVRQRLSVRNSSSEWSLHPEGQQMLRRRMGGEYKRHVDLKRREISWNDDCELPSESRNKKIRKKLSFTEGNCKRCFIRKLNPEFW